MLWLPWVLAVGISFVAWGMFETLGLLNIAMLFMIPLVVGAFHYTQWVLLGYSLVVVNLFNYLFVPPRLSFTFEHAHHLLGFAIMIVIAQMVRYLVAQAAKAQTLSMAQTIQDALLESLSHELRTPLAAIKGASSSLLFHELIMSEGQRLRLITTIDENAEVMEKHLDNLISAAKLKNGLLTLKVAWCDLEELIGSALVKTESQPMAHFEPPHSALGVWGNAIFLEQALINLLDNAFKYGQEVHIELIDHPHTVAIEITNTGLLPTPEELERIQEPFMRLSNASTHHGLGLGLHVVRLIAQIHHSTLHFAIHEGRFVLTWTLPKGESCPLPS